MFTSKLNYFVSFPFHRLQLIQQFSSKIENQIFYSPAQAVKCITNLTYPSKKKTCEVTIELNPNVPKSTLDISGEITLPYSIDATKNIYVVSDKLKKKDLNDDSLTVITSENLLKQVNDNLFEADALFATPEVVEKLIPIAPILGPRRLMPSIKNGTVSDNILEAIRLHYQPTISYTVDDKLHICQTLGFVNKPDKELVANLKAFMSDIATKKPHAMRSLYRKVYLTSGNSPRYFIENRFVIPGKAFFNETMAKPDLPMPAKKIKAIKANVKVVNALFDNPFSEEEDTTKPNQTNKTNQSEIEEDDQW